MKFEEVLPYLKRGFGATNTSSFGVVRIQVPDVNSKMRQEYFYCEDYSSGYCSPYHFDDEVLLSDEWNIVDHLNKPVEIKEEKKQYSPKLTTRENSVYRNGEKFYLKGANIPDVGFMSETSEFGNKDPLGACLELVELGVNCIRLPIHIDNTSAGWLNLETPEEYCENYLKPVTDFLQEKKIYYIIDCHIVNDWSSDRMINKLFAFWEFFGWEYKNNPYAIFELTNEPIYPDSAKEFFKKVSAQLYHLIRREIECNNLIIFGSPSWSTRPHQTVDLVPEHFKNWALSLHVYPNQDFKKIRRYEYATKKCPVIVTEFGYGNKRIVDDNGNYSLGSSDKNKRKNWNDWGKDFIEWMEESEVAGDIFWNYSCSNWTPNTHFLKNGEWELGNMEELLERLGEKK